MAGIARSIEIEYLGETYHIDMNMGLINKIELAGINVLGLAMELEKNPMPPTSVLSTMLAMCLNSAGKQVTPEDIWAELCNGDSQAVISCATILLNSMFPDVADDDEKKTKPAKK